MRQTVLTFRWGLSSFKGRIARYSHRYRTQIARASHTVKPKTRKALEILNRMKRAEIVDESHDNRTGIAHLSHANRTIGHYTGVQVAQDCDVKESTIRKWLTIVGQAVPYDWLKVGGKYTDLGTQLMQDYADRVSRGAMHSETWISEIRNWFEAQPRRVDVVPADSALALVSNDATATALDGYLAQLGDECAQLATRVDLLMDDLAADEVALLHAEIEAARQKGTQKATMLYAAEKQAQNEATQLLRQREIERKRQGG